MYGEDYSTVTCVFTELAMKQISCGLVVQAIELIRLGSGARPLDSAGA